MNLTDNLKLSTVLPEDNPTVSEFFQKLAGSANNSNMEIIDDEFEKYAKIDDLDSTGAVREAGGIVPYVDYVAQTESDVLIVTMTYTNGFECDVSFAQITSAYNSGKTCMLYANTGTNGGNKCVYMLGYLDSDQAIFTAISNSQLYQFRIGSDNTITFSQTSLGTVTNISDSVTTESSETAASSTAVKTAYDAAMAAVQASEKGIANGVATLDSSGKIPSGQLPSMNYIPTSQKGAASGVAPLNASKKVDSTYLPTIPSLSTSVSSTSTTTAATSSAVKQAYDLANSAIPMSQKNVANGVAGLDGSGCLGTLTTYDYSCLSTNFGTIDSSSYVGVRNSPSGQSVYCSLKLKLSSGSATAINISASGIKSEGFFGRKLIYPFGGIYREGEGSYFSVPFIMDIYTHSTGFELSIKKENNGSFTEGSSYVFTLDFGYFAPKLF